MDIVGVGISFFDLAGVGVSFLAGILIYGVLFSLAYTIVFYIPKRLNEIEERIKRLEDKEK